jgi:nitroreductase
MDGNKISNETLDQILEATQLSASSYGLQPYTILVISDEEVKAKLLPAAYNQPQIVESSHLMVFCVPEKITQEHVDAYMNDIAETRGMNVADLKGFSDTISGTINSLTPEQHQVWATKQAYIALGSALAAAAEQKVDATPMEGFSAPSFDEILNLKEQGLKSVVVLALGYRSETDVLANAPKVRKSKEVLYSFLN